MTAQAQASVAERSEGPGRLPDFYVVGHPKSGTTALHVMLSQHPRVHLGRNEPRYFAPELRVRDLPRPGGTLSTLEEYRAWFSGATPEQLVGDISPVYLWSREAAGMIAEATPQARIIAILREPASFLRSLHRQWLRNYVEVETDLRRALELEGERREGREIPRDTYWPNALLYSEQVRYVEQLRRFEERFAPEQMLVLIYDDYRREGEATVRRVLRFLDLEADVPIVERETHPSVEVRSRWLHEAIRNLMVSEKPPLRILKGSLKAALPMRVRQGALHTIRQRLVFRAPEDSDDELMLELRRRFAPEVHALSEHLGRDLVSLWGYDKLG
jgi:hypothetical protein